MNQNDTQARQLPPICPAQLDGEDPMGYYLRLAHVNGLSNPNWLLRSPGRPSPGVNGRARFCALCLAEEDPFWREAWSIIDRPWCAKHGTWLHDVCGHCGKLCTWRSVRLLSCRCGVDLRKMEATAVAAATLQVLQGSQVPVGVLHWFGVVDQHGLRGKPFKKILRRGVPEMARLLITGAHWAASPSALSDLLERVRVPPEKPGTLQLLNTAFPGLTEHIKRIPDPHWQSVMTAALDAYVKHSHATDTPIVGRNLDPRSRPRTQFNVARKLGVTVGHLTELLASQNAEAVPSRITRNGRTRRFVPEAAVEEARRLLADKIPRSQAAELLGFAPNRLAQLLKDGLLHETGGVMSRAELRDFTASIIEAASCATPPDRETTTLSHALRYWITVPNTRYFVEAVLAGELTLYKTTEEWVPCQLRVVTSEIVSWSQRAHGGNDVALTVAQAAKRLGVKRSVAYDLVNRRLLRVEIGRPYRRRSQVVTTTEVARFTNTYVPLTVLGKDAGIAPKERYAWAVREGLDLVTGPLVDGCVKYFVRRNSLARAVNTKGAA